MRRILAVFCAVNSEALHYGAGAFFAGDWASERKRNPFMLPILCKTFAFGG
jgi:hypothetical protein